jgi:uncharacterized protein (DUF362 family)
VVTDILGVDPTRVPTVAQSIHLGYCPDWSEIQFPLLSPQDLYQPDWQLPDQLMPIDFGLPRVLRSSLKHFYIRFIKETMPTAKLAKLETRP